MTWKEATSATMARLAAIDIGSNAIRLRVVDVDAPQMTEEGPRFYPFRDVLADRAAVRLGHDVFTKGRLEVGVIGAACDALRRFRVAMDAAKVERYRAVATSAAREASNGELLLERAERESRVHVEIIEGVEEARLVQLAVVERIPLGNRRTLLVDIGGGSTELTLLDGRRPIFARSLPVGTVRLLEAFLDGRGPIDAGHRKLLEEYIDRTCADAFREIDDATDGAGVDAVMGTGGNLETLADLCPLPVPFPEGRAIEVRAMRRLIEELATRTIDERIATYNLRPDRADTIVPAATVLCRVAEAFGRDAIAAPGVGLKEGVLVELAREHFVPRDFGGEASSVTDACLRLGRRYHFDEQHGTLVARFATRLFDDLAPRHRMSPRDRILLHAAALLHDVGDFVRYEGHHKHSYYLIVHADLMGLSPTEREIVANVARYHRKSPPQVDHENFRTLSREDRAKVKAMASILRIADALDREHRAKVTGVGGRIDGESLVLELSGTEDRSLEEWTLAAKCGMLKDALGLDVRMAEGSTIRTPGTSPPPRRPTEPPSGRG